MRIVQIVASLNFGDAVGNHIVALHRYFQNYCESKIYAISIADSLRSFADQIEQLETDKDDVILYHLATGCSLNRAVLQFQYKKLIVNYHNITPAKYFQIYDPISALRMRQAYSDVRELARYCDAVIGASDYNLDIFRQLGCDKPMVSIPICIPYDDYSRSPKAETIERYGGDGFANLLFVGRVAPNKRHEKIIEDYIHYRTLNKDSRLFLVGSSSGNEIYFQRLQDFVDLNNVQNVVFTGSVSFPEILAYYQLADVFICESDHEGFCVPLAESMCFGLPIIARNTSAIAETLDGHGILLENETPEEVATVIDRVINSPVDKAALRHKYESRLKAFDSEVVGAQFLAFLSSMHSH